MRRAEGECYEFQEKTEDLKILNIVLHLQSHTDSATHFSADYKTNVRQGFTGRRPNELNVSGPEAVCQMNGG